LQAQSRGELVRRRFRNRMQELSAFERQAITVSRSIQGSTPPS
jgi:hypothetical protein